MCSLCDPNCSSNECEICLTHIPQYGGVSVITPIPHGRDSTIYAYLCGDCGKKMKKNWEEYLNKCTIFMESKVQQGDKK
jgi:hypothetical protein